MAKHLFPVSDGVHLVLFHTEGFPWDHGKDLSEGASQLANSAVGSFRSVRVFTPRRLLAAEANWEESLRDYTPDVIAHPLFSERLEWNRGWAKLGLQQWKPRLVAQLVEHSDIPEGDIVFYHDSDAVKYPEYLAKVSLWAPWIAKQMKSVDVLAFNDNNVPLTSDTKTELIERVLADTFDNRLRHLWSGAIAVRKSDAGREFAGKWFELSTIENLMPVTRDAEKVHFHQHSVDQATLSCLWHTSSLRNSGIRRKVVYLHKTRSIPPPSLIERIRKKAKRRIRKAIRSWKSEPR